jgi:Glycosyl transferase family 2
VGRPAALPGIFSEDGVTGSSSLAPARHGPIAIMTMVYNESTNLPIWIGHYRRTAPSANLFVIDHGSDDGSIAQESGVTRIPLPRDQMDERDRTFLINSLQQGFLRYYDIVIYTDCDELLVPDPNKSTALDAYLWDQSYPYASPIGLNVLHITDIEPELDFTQPLLRQRQYGQFQSSMCKPLITRIPLTWEPGFHTCDRRPHIDKNLYLFHIKQIDRAEALRRQHIVQRLPWSGAAIEAKHGAHHRYDDERFLREFFLDPANELRRQGAREFVFDAEIARLQQESQEHSGVFGFPDFKGPVVGLPGIIRAAF